MAYNDTPLANQRIKDTQAPIRQNFQSIQTAFSVDHVAIENLPDQGKHNKVTFPVQGGAPAFGATELGMYSLSYNGVNQVFMHRTTGTDRPFTASGVSTLPTVSGSAHGYTYLPSGVLLKWGQFGMVNPGNNVFTLPLIDGAGVAIPDFVTFINAQITTIAVAITGSVRFNSYTLATRLLSVNANTSAPSVSFYYFMIGT